LFPYVARVFLLILIN